MRQRAIDINGYSFVPSAERIPLMLRAHLVWEGTIADCPVLLVSWGRGALSWAVVKRESRTLALSRSTTAHRAVDAAWAALVGDEIMFT